MQAKSARPQALHSALATAWLCLAASVSAQDKRDARLFRVPTDPDAVLRADNALRFALEENWGRLAEELQVLFVEHADSVLPERFAAGLVSQFEAYTGASAWAKATLAALPAEAQSAYRRRFAEAAALDLAAARQAADPRALTDVAVHFPFTPAARDAYTTLGDLALARGDRALALAAWSRARDAAREQADGEPASLAQRAALEAKLLGAAESTGSADSRRRGFELPGAATGAGPLPLASADRWVNAEVDLEPFNGMRGSERYNLIPLLAGDRLLVSTSLVLYCLDVYTARILWQSQPDPAWAAKRPQERARLFERIDRRLCLVSAAAGRGVAVAALQTPYEDAEDHDYQGIEIMGPLPERRLYAFELESGRPLWDHAPPADWDGESGSFEERMLVAGPPVVHGTRVLVPCYRLRGRIDMHVACYDLQSGERLWSTGLISGQDELNMFGRLKREYSAPPVVVEGDAVYALTQLGSLACLDLFSGAIRWEASYEQIPIPKNEGWEDIDREAVWRNAPPVVAGDAVIAAPHDSFLVLGVDKHTGAVLWSQDYNNLPAAPGVGRGSYGVLLGAAEDTLYLGGSVVSALRRPGGLAFRGAAGQGQRPQPFEVRWSVPVGEVEERLPRPVLGSDEVAIPTPRKLIVVARKNGLELASKSFEWNDSDQGNLLLGKGLLVSLGNRKVWANFDWNVLLERAEAALTAAPGDVPARIEHAELLLRRARSYREERRYELARPLLERARSSLEELLKASGARDARIANPLYEVLMEDAANARVDLDPDRALATLQDALALAPTPAAVRDTLLAEEELLRARDAARWEATLVKLGREVPGELLPAARLEESADWLVGESLFAVTGADLRDVKVPVGLWVLFTRADARARSRDAQGALEELHEALARYGEEPLVFGLTSGDFARARIARRIELDGSAPYHAFEGRAEELLARADAARDPGLMADVARLYPHSAAASRAEEARLKWALAAEDLPQAARLFFAGLAGGRALGPGDAAHLVEIAGLFHAAGNVALEHGLLAYLGASFPDQPGPGGKPLAEVRRELLEAKPPALPEPTFGEALARAAVREGRYVPAGRALLERGDAESPPASIDFFLERRELVAFSAADPTRDLWFHVFEETPLEGSLFQVQDRVLLALPTSIVALSAADGTPAWTYDAGSAEIDSLTVHQGLALVLSRGADAAGRARQTLRALDGYQGIELWAVETGARTDWLAPVCGDGMAVLCFPLWSQPSAALVVDLFAGRIVRETSLGVAVLGESWNAAWIEDGNLIIPFFSASRDGPSRLQAFDVASGEPSWSLAFSPGKELYALAEHAGKRFLILLAVDAALAGEGGEVLELDGKSGRERKLHTLKPGERVMLARQQHVRLSSACLFTFAPRNGAASIPVRLIPLDKSPGWTYHLQVAEEELYDSGMPPPAVSSNVVALVYSTKNRANLAREEARLELVDRQGGFRRQAQTLSPDLARCMLQAQGLGNALLILGTGRQSQRDISRMEILETRDSR